MTKHFDEQVFYYKNFKMGNEIDVAGSFIYQGIKDLGRIDALDECSEVFSFLYHFSVGVERLQKVLLVLLEEIKVEEYPRFEKSLITHNHQALHAKIAKKSNIKFSCRENRFLEMMAQFYEKFRYNRFSVIGDIEEEGRLLEGFVLKELDKTDYEYHWLDQKVMVLTDRTKEIMGRTIGSISRKYYSEIVSQARERNLFTYELRSGSPAQKVFLSRHKKDSLQEQNVIEQVALVELVVFLLQTINSSAFIEFLKTIEPLEIDPEMIGDYIHSLSKGIIPQELIDEVEYLYTEYPNPNRLEAICAALSPNAYFDIDSEEVDGVRGNYFESKDGE